MRIFGYEVMKGQPQDAKFWLTFVVCLPQMIGFIVWNELRKQFYQTVWGIGIYHKTFERYKNSPLFSFRYKELGIQYAIEAFSMREFTFFRRQVWNDKPFLTELFWHPYETVGELLESDTYWKKVWSAKLENE